MTEKEKLLRREKLMERSVKIIQKGGRILIRRLSEERKLYLHHWSNIAAGPDKADWSSDRSLALEMFTLEWAFAIAPLYDAHVVSVFPKKKKKTHGKGSRQGSPVQQGVPGQHQGTLSEGEVCSHHTHG